MADSSRQNPPAGDGGQRRVIATSWSGWITILALLASIGAFTKAALVSDGIISDEKGALVLMLALASALLVWSFVVNMSQNKGGGIISNVISLFLLAMAFIVVGKAWR
jgi:hypothetical protein